MKLRNKKTGEMNIIIDIIKLWVKLEGIEKIKFNMFTHDRGGMMIKNLYKVFSDDRNYNTHIVFTSPGIFIKEGTYTIQELEKLLGGEE